MDIRFYTKFNKYGGLENIPKKLFQKLFKQLKMVLLF